MKKLNEISVRFAKGVGPAKAKLFENLGIQSIEDLISFFPRRYEDRRQITPIAQAQLGKWQTIIGKVLRKSSKKSWHTRKHVLDVIIDDQSGRIACTWFNQPYLDNYFKQGKTVVCYGKVDEYKNILQMIAPEYEIIEDENESLSLKRIVPIYPLTRGVTQRFLRKIIMQCIEEHKDQIEDELPIPLRNRYRLYNIKRSMENIHFPVSFEDQENALKRISFEEFYFYQLSILSRRVNLKQKQGFSHSVTDSQILKFINGFDFELTGAQKKVLREIKSDMTKASPMLRLLQGDVGSGKTLVALFGCYVASLNSKQSAIMAPTEILALQHYQNIQQILASGVLGKIKVAYMASSLTKKEKDSVCRKIQDGTIDVVVGTHALISEGIVFKDLSFAVIDEQHKFGVRQRALLSEKGHNPDVLIMTATPIPRTLYISLYGDMDVSVIDEMPSGRGKIKTFWYAPEERDSVYQKIKEKLQTGSQVYFVYPLIEQSDKMDLKAAMVMYAHFQKKVFKDFKIGLVHGRLPKDEANTVMLKFKNKEIDVLVATTVVEVGVDVPNAGVIVIEHAERFGLSQLHQLRGRVGRGIQDSLCFLIGDPKNEEGSKRLEVMVSTNDGFTIAQEDLMIRGPGSFFGRHQHGFSELRVANPSTQLDLLALARKEAIALIKADPKLEMESNQAIKKVIKRRYPEYLQMVQAG